MENQVFWRRYIEISHSGEEQIPDPIYRGSDFQYTMPLVPALRSRWPSECSRRLAFLRVVSCLNPGFFRRHRLYGAHNFYFAPIEFIFGESDLLGYL